MTPENSCVLIKSGNLLNFVISRHFYTQLYFQEVEVDRWPLTPMSVGSNPSAAVDCLP